MACIKHTFLPMLYSASTVDNLLFTIPLKAQERSGHTDDNIGSDFFYYFYFFETKAG